MISFASSFLHASSHAFGMRYSCFLSIVLLIGWLALPAHAILDLNQNGMSDVWEKHYNDGNLFPNTFTPSGDQDQDGWSNATESIAGTSPLHANLANNGMVIPRIQDAGSLGFFQIEHPAIRGKTYLLQGSTNLLSWLDINEAVLAQTEQLSSVIGVSTTTGAPPEKFFWRLQIGDVDSDEDELTNYEESLLQTNPYHDDSDNDGIRDKNEIMRHLDPLNPDSDDDGLRDGDEDTQGTSAILPDTDGDTIHDGDEIAQGTNPLLTDTDGDGLSDAQEKIHGSNPTLADTDGDGISDGQEITNGTSPVSHDTDGDGIPDSTDTTPLVNNAIADPDRAGLTPALLNGLTSLWAFESTQNFNFGGTMASGYPNLIAPSLPMRSYASAISNDGLISKSTELTSAYSSLITAPQAFSGRSNWSVAFWVKIAANSIQGKAGNINTVFWAYNNGNGIDYSDTTPEFIFHAYKALTATAPQKLIISHYHNSTLQPDIVTDIPLSNRLDDDTWQYFTITKQNSSVKLYRNGILLNQFGTTVASYTPTATGYFAIGRVHQATIADTSLRGKIDRFTIHNRALTQAEVTAFFNLDSDKDSLPDRIENATGYWRDTNANGIKDNGEIKFIRNPFLWENLNLDSDDDGLNDSQEYALATQPTNPDSDGDLMPDGWEKQYNLNPLSAGDANLDPDNDGLSNLNEYRYNTNPRIADTDGDGKSDGAEAKGPDGNLATDDGSNPSDPGDSGVRPAATDLLTLKLGIGDNSGSHSEDYVLNVFQTQPDGSEKRIYTLRSGGFGLYQEETKSFPRDKTYTFQIDWQGTTNQSTGPQSNPEGADFDYDFIVEPISGHESHTLIDAYDPKTKSVDTSQSLRGNRNNITEFLTSHEPKRVLLLRAAFLVDANRDGQFSKEDEGQITEQKPWRFWINEDNDWGDTGGTDRPAEFPNMDLGDSRCNGIRDLIDFFPVKLEILDLLHFFPSGSHQYIITQEYDLSKVPSRWGKSGSGYMEWKDAMSAKQNYEVNSSASYLQDLDTAFACEKLMVTTVKDTIEQAQHLSWDFLNACKKHEGLLLFEAKNQTNKPIQLRVFKKASQSQETSEILKLDLPVSFARAADMIRYKYVNPGSPALTISDMPAAPTNWPDADRNDKHFVFVHGYNVNPQQSEAWAAELFKKLFWSGSNAKFSAFAWYGYQSQIALASLTPDYQINLVNAFATSHSLKQFLDLLSGEKTVAAHSMGNVIMGSAMHDWGCRPANYIMFNAAAAKECYDPAEANEANQEILMVHPWWEGYMKELRASEWHKLDWPQGDERKNLTWRGRLRNVIENGGATQVYNFYSSGEEVLNNPAINNPDLSSDNPSLSGLAPWLTANKTWAMQEKRKGWGITGYVHSSNYGGWYPNMKPYDPQIHEQTPNEGIGWRMKTPSELPVSGTEPFNAFFMSRLRERPFFDDSKHPTLFESARGPGTIGSEYAKQWSNILLAQMIPCTTLAAGRNPLKSLGNEIDALVTPGRNADMQRLFMTDSARWPYRPKNHDPEENLERSWCHSDIREVSFSHQWKVFAKIVEIGNLK